MSRECITSTNLQPVPRSIFLCYYRGQHSATQTYASGPRLMCRCVVYNIFFPPFSCLYRDRFDARSQEFYILVRCSTLPWQIPFRCFRFAYKRSKVTLGGETKKRMKKSSKPLRARSRATMVGRRGNSISYRINWHRCVFSGESCSTQVTGQWTICNFPVSISFPSLAVPRCPFQLQRAPFYRRSAFESVAG